MTGRLGYEELRALTLDESMRADGLSPSDAPEGWWAARGVDPDGVTRFCAEQAREDLRLLVELRAPSAAAIVPVLAMTYEVGLLLGWRLHDRRAPEPLRMSVHDRARVGEIVAGEGDWFSARLLRLVAKADGNNRERLRVVFPEHVAAYEAWAFS